MAEEESGSRRRGFVETLREGWKPPQKHSEGEDAKTAETPTTEKSKKPTEEVAATKSGNGAGTEPAATKAATEAGSDAKTKPAAKKGAETPDPNLSERIEGLQGWMAEIERKQRRMTMFGTFGTVLAVAAAGAALYFAIAAPNTASKDDLDDLEAQVETLQQQVTQATTDQNRLKALNASIQSLNTRVAAAEQRANQNATEIAAAKAQAQAAQQAATAAQQAPAPAPAPTTPPGNPNPNPNP